MTFPEYMKYINFACDEELERLQDFLHCMKTGEDCTEDKYFVAFPQSNCPPDMPELVRRLQGRDHQADFLLMNEESDARDELYYTLRDLLLYS